LRWQPGAFRQAAKGGRRRADRGRRPVEIVAGDMTASISAKPALKI
jgi:hypothetical protein